MDTKYLIVAYDIVDNHLRTSIAELLMYHGLVRIQYSIFAGEVSENNVEDLSDTLFDMELGDEDDITMFILCKNCQNLIRSVKPLPHYIKHLSI